MQLSFTDFGRPMRETVRSIYKAKPCKPLYIVEVWWNMLYWLPTSSFLLAYSIYWYRCLVANEN